MSTFYFDSGVGTPSQHVSAVALFLGGTEARRTPGASWATEEEVVEIDTVTGNVLNITNVTPTGGTGSAAGDGCPLATQGVARLITGLIVGGRLLRGRLFLPAVPESESASTGPTTTYINAYNSALATLVASANADWSVWSRTHGQEGSVTGATIWPKWGVLRSRRD